MEDEWKGLVVDLVKIDPRRTEHQFFTENNERAFSIHQEDENAIVRRIVSFPELFNLLMEKAGVQAYSDFRVGVPRKVLDDRPGDFDLILHGPTAPFDLACFEFKRIKVCALDDQKDRINKLNEIKKLYAQTRERLALGFSGVFAVVIIHGDLRDRPTGNFLFKGYSDETNEVLWEELVRHNLPEEAGLILVKYNQPLHRNSGYHFWVKRLKWARHREQSGRFRERYFDFLRRY